MTSMRQKRIASLIREELSRCLQEEFQDRGRGLISVTDVRISADLRIAHVSVSLFGETDKTALLEELNSRRGHLRKCVASKIKLKYNPMLIFALDDSYEQSSRIDELLKSIKGR